jgi:hypothetical protein
MAGTFDAYVVLDPAKLAEIMRSPSGPVVRQLFEDGELVKAEAKRLVGVSKPDPVPGRRNPRRPGTLRDSIVKRLTTDETGVVVLVGSDSPIALYHHEGTQPHPIVPKDPSKFLVFWWDKTGRVMYLKRVQHPGTRPNRFLTGALRVLAGRYR